MSLLQSCTCPISPVQSNLSLFSVKQVLVLAWRPPPHVEEHGVHLLQPLHVLGIETEGSEGSFVFSLNSRLSIILSIKHLSDVNYHLQQPGQHLLGSLYGSLLLSHFLITGHDLMSLTILRTLRPMAGSSC